jgi:hypothetical protein
MTGRCQKSPQLDRVLCNELQSLVERLHEPGLTRWKLLPALSAAPVLNLVTAIRMRLEANEGQAIVVVVKTVPTASFPK